MCKTMMRDDQLERLLRTVAEDDVEPAPIADLADRVRRLSSVRSKRLRVLGGGVAALLLAAVGFWLTVGGKPKTALVPNEEPGVRQVRRIDGQASDDPIRRSSGDTHSSEIVAMRNQIKQLQEELAELKTELREDEDRRQFKKQLVALRRTLRKPDPRDLIKAEEAKTAFLLSRRAEAYEKQNLVKESRREYEQLVRLCPDTSWARAARSKLNQKPQTKE
jgi:hypothetical protein